jgi:hypothetical protein
VVRNNLRVATVRYFPQATPVKNSIHAESRTLLLMTTIETEVQPLKNISAHHNTYPRLKNGVYISRAATPEVKSIHVATSRHAIEIFHGGARAIISQLNGLQTPEEISTVLSAPIEVIDRVLTELKDAHFIDTVRNKITLHNRFQSAIASRSANTQDQSLDAAFSQLQKRLAPELSQATWIVGVNDGGVELLSNRQNFGVEIFGSSRTATLICSILLASGVTNTRMALTSTQQHPTVIDSDLGTGALRTCDIGLNFRGRLEELSREWSLFPVASHRGSTHKPVAEIIPERILRIIVGNYEPELIEHLTHDTQDHLFVGKIAGGVATCGPLVMPGRTPCIQCLALGAEERYGSFQSELMATQGTSDELPIAIAHQLAAIAAHTALCFIDTGTSSLIGAQIQVNYLEPLTPKLNSFSRHPRCHCVWREGNSEFSSEIGEKIFQS